MTDSQNGAGPLGADAPQDRKRLMVGGGIAAGLAVVGGAAYVLLLSGGGSTDASSAPVPTHHAAAASGAAASASPSASPTVAALAVFRGAVGRDPFQAPDDVVAALSPAPAASAAAPVVAAPVASASAAALPSSGTVAIGAVPTGSTGGGVIILDPSLPSTGPGGGTGTGGTGTGGTGTGGTGTGSTTGGTGTGGTGTTTQMPVIAPTTPVAAPVQFLELLRVRHAAKGWYATVRTNNGVVEVLENTPNVGGTKFFFVGEDETSGKPTFVFTVGESEGGNLVPNAKLTAKSVKPGNSTLTLKNGSVTGGIVAE